MNLLNSSKMEKSDAIASVCLALSNDDNTGALSTLQEHYPTAPEVVTINLTKPIAMPLA